MMNDVTFANPEFFWLFLLLPVLLLWYIFKRHSQMASLSMTTTAGIRSKSYHHWLLLSSKAFKLVAFAALIVALARPQVVSVDAKTETTKGIDIVMAIDVSSSMLAKDLKPNRLVALKEVASEFIKDRSSDRIGLVVYAGESYTKTPITSDKNIALQSLREINNGILEDGTAIGMGLATSVNRLKDSKALSKVIILLTDGINNAGFIEPKTAADLALEYYIKVYTIGIGTNGNAISPIGYNPDGTYRYGMRQVEIDEELLKEIASLTGGQYFRATDNQKLESIYKEINKLEKTEIEEFKFYSYEEKYRIWALLAFGLLSIDFIVRKTFLRSFI
jgi:Ca-activated chloride channel family protein